MSRQQLSHLNEAQKPCLLKSWLEPKSTEVLFFTPRHHMQPHFMWAAPFVIATQRTVVSREDFKGVMEAGAYIRVFRWGGTRPDFQKGGGGGDPELSLKAKQSDVWWKWF